MTAAPGANSRIARLLRSRGLARRGEALALAQATLRKLRKVGVSARIVGSLAKGTFRADSDVDYLIEDRGGLTESRVSGLIETAMRGFPFDVVFADRVDPILLKFMREEAKRGASVIRAP